MAIFNSYVSHYQRVNPTRTTPKSILGGTAVLVSEGKFHWSAVSAKQRIEFCNAG